MASRTLLGRLVPPALLLLVLADQGCGHQRPTKPADPQFEGKPLSLPVAGEFPRAGLQWTYSVKVLGAKPGERFSPWVVYRFQDAVKRKDGLKKLWACEYYYGGAPSLVNVSFESVLPDFVGFHPPRALSFVMLEWAPFPNVQPGGGDEWSVKLYLGSWATFNGEAVLASYHQFPGQAVSSALGRFPNAVRVEAATPRWHGTFWWVPRVGWLRWLWQSNDGRTIELQLTQVRQIDQPPR